MKLILLEWLFFLKKILRIIIPPDINLKLIKTKIFKQRKRIPSKLANDNF